MIFIEEKTQWIYENLKYIFQEYEYVMMVR